MTLDDLHVQQAIRDHLPCTLAGLRDLTGRGAKQLHNHLTRLQLLGCVTRTAAHIGAADVWREAPGATWAHLKSMGVNLG